MRFRTWLLWVAAAGCGGGSGGNGGGGDASTEGVMPCTGPCCGATIPTTTHSITSAVACSIEGEVTNGPGKPCWTACGAGLACSLPGSYQQQFDALNADAGVSADGGREVVCPTVAGDLTLTCTEFCSGRRTEGFDDAGAPMPRHEGERFAAMARLESISVHAFDRLERELVAHTAPPGLVRDARRARRDEVRHTAMTTRLGDDEQPVEDEGLRLHTIAWLCREARSDNLPASKTIRLDWLDREYWQLVKRLVPDVRRLIGGRAFRMHDRGFKLEADAMLWWPFNREFVRRLRQSSKRPPTPGLPTSRAARPAGSSRRRRS